MATKSNHHPRRPPADNTLLKPGQQLHMDWCFVGDTSIRGHVAILCIKCANTRKCWCFPCPSKRTPLEIVQFFIHFLAKALIFVLQVRVDEDGSSANFAEFCKLLHTNNITLQTTGSYSSDLNGNVEILNKTLKRGAGVILANAGLPLPFSCYTTVHFCNILNFLSYNHDKSKTAFEAWYGKKPDWKNFRIFGCDVYVMKETGSKNTLSKAMCNKFLGWGSSTSLIHYLDTSTNNIKRARHVYFDDFSSATPPHKLTPGGLLLRNEFAPPPVATTETATSTIFVNNDSQTTTNPEVTLADKKETKFSSSVFPSLSPSPPTFDTNIINFHNRIDPPPFDQKNFFQYKFNLSNCKIFPYGVFIHNDDHFGLTLIKEIPNNSPWYLNLPGNLRRNVWLLAVNNNEPITPSAAYQSIEYSIKNKV